jgi:hypothetical protein
MSEDEVDKRFEAELRALMGRYSVASWVVSYHFRKSRYVRVALTTGEEVKEPGVWLHELLECAHDSIHERHPESCVGGPPERMH